MGSEKSGCVDMIFVARQLVEKAREHNESLYMLFVDLKKVYDQCAQTSPMEGPGEVWRATKVAELGEVF